jgi:cell wall-associated NlpC family hydrolase
LSHHRVITPVADIHGAPDETALRGKFESQLVYGETFTVDREENGWCHGVSAQDGYGGYVQSKLLQPTSALKPPTHVVIEARTPVYRDASIKSPRLDVLSFGSIVTITEEGEKFSHLFRGGWVYNKHLTTLDLHEEDYVSTAKKFLETPYYWGGRSGFGIDCSGLVQVSLARAGILVPRDTEKQTDVIGQPIDTTPRTGDIVFFPGHVGIMVDDENILHANAFHMKTCIEPLWVVDERSGGITATRRIG